MNRQAKASSCPPLLVLERELLGELAPDAARAFRAHLAACPICTGRLATLREENARYRQSVQARRARSALAERGSRSQLATLASRWKPLLLVPAAALCGLLLVIAVRSPSLDVWRPMGHGALHLFVQRGSAASPWDGSPLAAGDAIQLTWSSPRATYLAVVARESDGTVTALFSTGGSAGRVDAGNDRPLGGSLRVDGRPFRLWAFERSEPFPLEPLLAGLRHGGEPSFAGRTTALDVAGKTH